MRSKELLYYFKRHKVISIMIYFQVTFFLLMLGIFASFLTSLDYEIDGLEKIYEGKSVYQMIDGYYNGSDFDEFMNQSDALVRLKKFYNGLNESEKFTYLSITEQPILIHDENVPIQIIDGRTPEGEVPKIDIDGQEFSPIQSIQMNEEAYKFFNLSLSKGNSWSSIDFEYKEGGIVPVLLGDSYEGFLKVGDQILLNHYGKTFQAEVVGFLKSNGKIFYNGNTEYYLNDLLIFPHLNFGMPKTSEEEYFQKIHYFAVINGYVITGNQKSSIQNTMDHINIISKQSNFENYSFIGLNPQFQKYSGLIKTMQENEGLVSIIFFLSFILNLVSINALLLLQQSRRLNYYATHLINGASKWDIVKQQWLEVGVLMFASFFTIIIFLGPILKLGTFNIYLFLFILTLGMTVLSSIFVVLKFLNKPISFYLRFEED